MIELLNWITANPWPTLWIGIVLIGVAYGLGPKAPPSA